jgi:hypothetical protein
LPAVALCAETANLAGTLDQWKFLRLIVKA